MLGGSWTFVSDTKRMIGFFVPSMERLDIPELNFPWKAFECGY
jgi:hypothetical protein